MIHTQERWKFNSQFNKAGNLLWYECALVIWSERHSNIQNTIGARYVTVIFAIDSENLVSRLAVWSMSSYIYIYTIHKITYDFWSVSPYRIYEAYHNVWHLSGPCPHIAYVMHAMASDLCPHIEYDIYTIKYSVWPMSSNRIYHVKNNVWRLTYVLILHMWCIQWRMASDWCPHVEYVMYTITYAVSPMSSYRICDVYNRIWRLTYVRI